MTPLPTEGSPVALGLALGVLVEAADPDVSNALPSHDDFPTTACLPPGRQQLRRDWFAVGPWMWADAGFAGEGGPGRSSA